MPLEIPRRRFLKVLTGMIAAPAVVKAERLMKVVAPVRRPSRFNTVLPSPSDYAGPFSFEWDRGLDGKDWRYHVRLCQIETLPDIRQTIYRWEREEHIVFRRAGMRCLTETAALAAHAPAIRPAGPHEDTEQPE
jgi:hypothetical protein